jgi:hypothetical protein
LKGFGQAPDAVHLSPRKLQAEHASSMPILYREDDFYAPKFGIVARDVRGAKT